MSIRNFLTRLNHPALVFGSGTALLVGLPAATTFCATAPLVLLQIANVVAFAVNCAAVSVPGRIDGQAQKAMQSGASPAAPSYDSIPDNDDGGASSRRNEYESLYSPTQGRSLVAPAGWAFAIWGPIYMGEAIFCASLGLFPSAAVTAVLPSITAPLVAAHLFQSLWCASFRPSYMSSSSSSWHKYVSVAMLGGTAYSLSLVHAVTAAAPFSWYFVPLTMHFGWTTAATLVNLNGSVAAAQENSDRVVIGLGHASALAATALGVTLGAASPVYGMTLAWALAACAQGIQKRRAKDDATSTVSLELQRGMNVQQWLCYAGSGICAAVAVGSFFL